LSSVSVSANFMANEFLILKFILLAVFLSFSAFFSASETALFSLDSIKLKRLAQEGKNTTAILALMENPLRCLTTILAGNTLVNIAISALITSVLLDIFGAKGVSISVGVTTFVLLLFGEVTPKTIAINNNERVASLFARPLYFFERFFRPFLLFSTRTCDGIISWLDLQPKKEPTLTEEEFRTVMEVGHRHGVVAKSEKERVVSILELTTTMAHEIMIPRTDVKAVSASWERQRVLEFARITQHSKFPVYKDSLDNVTGVLHAKDLFLENEKPLQELVKPVLFIPATKHIHELIKDLYKQNARIAIVVDEYGGTAGLVTLEDILEEIFGEIHDEFEAPEKLIESLGDQMYRISGKTPVEQVEAECGLHVKEGAYKTMAGFILDIFGKIPLEGERLQTPEGEYTVEKLVGRRIKSVLVKKWI